MKTAAVRDLRYHFSQIEAQLERGEEIEIRKRKRVIARLVPVPPKLHAYPDFGARAREIFGDRVTELTGTQIVSEGGEPYWRTPMLTLACRSRCTARMLTRRRSVRLSALTFLPVFFTWKMCPCKFED